MKATKDWSLTYEGSVKRVWRKADDESRLLFEFSDDYSVFDWGKMPDTIENKGKALACLGAWWFEKLADAAAFKSLPDKSCLKRFDKEWLEQRWNHPVFKNILCQKGVPSHYLGLVDQSFENLSLADAAGRGRQILLAVQPVVVKRPGNYKIANQTVYHYDRREPDIGRTLVPIEMVFRFGMPPGSSLKKRINDSPDYATLLGLSDLPGEGDLFNRPVVEFFTKLEPSDRLLTRQEALLISNLSPQSLEEMIELTYAIALQMYVLFDGLGVELWDGKLEFALERSDRGDSIILVDSIGPDELRLIMKGIHLSKEMIRQYYRGSEWEKAVRDAKELAGQRGSGDWLDICRNELRMQPEKLSPSFKTLVDQLYGTLTNYITSLDLIPGQPEMSNFLDVVSEELANRGGVPNAT